MKLIQTTFKHTILLSGLLLLTDTFLSCTNIDCPLDSVVVMTINFFDTSAETSAPLDCTLSIAAAGTDTLLNAEPNVKSVQLPMSIGAAIDTLYLIQTDGETTITDTLYISHTNEPHFEAMDCPGAVFHHITDLSFVPHTDGMLSYTLDSVSIIRPLVDFSDVENIRIFYHHPADVSLLSVGR